MEGEDGGLCRGQAFCSKWEAGMATFCKPFTKAAVKYFDHANIEDARAWIQEA
ncbi:UspA domain protein [Rhodopirellula baltica WH47]|uniref:UspA domain protein n=1 Tax=Rhodopirellula baltica WH47 TaxID=991778 RepID=F2AW61_RHOBT|nr:UspA domain protein [Rhodopirellula baltica WH47]